MWTFGNWVSEYRAHAVMIYNGHTYFDRRNVALIDWLLLNIHHMRASPHRPPTGYNADEERWSVMDQ